jgi:hypothetical protein
VCCQACRNSSNWPGANQTNAASSSFGSFPQRRDELFGCLLGFGLHLGIVTELFEVLVKRQGDGRCCRSARIAAAAGRWRRR